MAVNLYKVQKLHTRHLVKQSAEHLTNILQGYNKQIIRNCTSLYFTYKLTLFKSNCDISAKVCSLGGSQVSLYVISTNQPKKP